MDTCTNPLVLQLNQEMKSSQITDMSFGLTAHVKNDGNIKSFYVAYSDSKFGSDGGGTGISRLVPAEPLSCSSEPVKTGFVVLSAQGFDVKDPGIVLFQHENQLGYGVAFTGKISQPDVNSEGTQPNGASSLICTGGKWELFTQENFEGSKVRITERGVKSTLQEIGLGDKIKSVKFVK